MVSGILELEVGVAELALLGAEVFKVLGAVVSVAELVLVIHPRAVLAAVGRSEEEARKITREGDETVCEHSEHKPTVPAESYVNAVKLR